MQLLLCLFAAYLLGSIPFSFVVAQRVKGIDLRRHGSGNLGATNIVRTLGTGWGVVVLLLDMGKGAVAVLLMSMAVSAWPEGRSLPLHLPPDIWRIAAGFLAAVGHTLSPFVSFHGGKGVATTSGAYFILAPYPTLTALAVFGLVFALTRIVSLGSLCAAAVLPVAVAFFEWHSAHFSKTIFFFTLFICIWVIHRHRANIERWHAGTEKPLAAAGNGAATESPSPPPTARRSVPGGESGDEPPQVRP
jgi:glycerol-3-phosphate acyltransferase PlsY